jgi:hypothetical protein
LKIAGVSTAWDEPSRQARAVLVLGHGAGGDLNDELLRAVAVDLTTRGVATLRFNFPYREAGRRSTGPQRHSEDCYRAIVDHARERSLPLYCGGKSYGGRMATHIAAAGVRMDGLVLLSYPLHPPGRPENTRDAHLKDVGAPMLIVQGTKDPFATPDLLHRTVASLENTTLVQIEGGDHSLRVRGRGRADVGKEIVEAIARFLGR